MMGIAFNHHRKLLDGDGTTAEDEQSSIPKSCKLYCDAQQNPPSRALLPGEPPSESPAVKFISHSKIFNIPLFLVIVLSILITGFFFLTCYAIYKLYMRWQRSRTRHRSLISREPELDDFIDEDYGPVLDHPIWYIRTIGLQPSVISSIAVVRFRKGDGLVEGKNCSVCLSEFEEDEEVRLLPMCSHAFHVPCIDTWLRSHTNCPMCRAHIVPNSSGLEVREGRRPGSDGEVVRDLSGDDGAEVTSRLNEDDEQELTQPSEHQIGFKTINENLGEKGASNSDGGGLDGIIQPMRRSVSFDSLFASRISAGIVNALPGKSNGNLITDQLIKGKESPSSSTTVKDQAGADHSFSVLVRSSSVERSMQRESCCSMKRSVSCSAQVFLSSYGSRNQNPACS